MLRLTGIDASYRLVTDGATFEAAIDEAQASVGQRIPVIHISSHGAGDGTGLVLTDGDRLTWEWLGDALAPIQQALAATGNGLIVGLSCCYGTKAAEASYRATPAFKALVANTGALNWDDGAIAFSVLYHRAFRGDAPEMVDGLIEAMTHASGDENFLIIEGQEVTDLFNSGDAYPEPGS